MTQVKNNWAIQLKVWSRAFVRDPKQFFRARDTYECSACGYKGYFATARRGFPNGPFRCPNCESRPRDRAIALFFKKSDIDFKGKKFYTLLPSGRYSAVSKMNLAM